MFTLNLPVDYHQQDKGSPADGKYYCGPTCAQMVLNFIGAGLLLQDDLYNDCQCNNRLDHINPPWETAPDGLRWTLNHRKPSAFRKRFKIIAGKDQEKISKKIAGSLYHDKVPVSALVFSTMHWIVIRGFDANVAPSGPRDDSYTIRAFWINNPWPPSSQRIPPSPPPPHSSGDLCGSRDHGKANDNISYDTWKQDYLIAVSVGQHWKDKFVAVCDPDEGPEDDGDDENGDEKNVGNEKEDKSENNQNEKNMVHDDFLKKVISKEQAKESAFKALKDYGLTDQEFLKEILKDVSAGEPELVRHLQRKNDFYYIVPLLGKDKNVHSLVNVDGKDGKYRQASFAKDLENPIVFKLLVEEEIAGLIKKHPGIKKEEINVNTRYMVWMPCIESFSPIVPFHEVDIGNYKVYVRIDGKIFTKLTTNIPGA